ncbi:MAG: glutathione S-transferase family protein [Alphaproteobacteria bacterium]|nr:glutathione S-transferase family protein [Alphaproteobacteria bacterium]
MALIVYGANLSPFVRKVRVVLAEKGLQYSLEPINPFGPPPEFVEISPLKRIPAFRDTDLPEPNHLADSSVICDYIEHKYPNPPLYPQEPYARARALWFEEYADSQIAASIVRPLFFERVVKKLLRQETDESICEAALRDQVPAVADYLEKEIGGSEFLVGNMFSIADASVGTMFVNMHHTGEGIDAGRWPKLAAYVARLHARPSFKAAIDEESPFVQRLRAAA